MVRCLLSVALTVALVAIGAFSTLDGILLIGIGFAVASHYAYYFHQNQQVIAELQATGFRPGMLIY